MRTPQAGFILYVMRHNRIAAKIGILAIAMLLASSAGVRADSLHIVRNLTFGEFATRDNDSPHTILVDASNNATYDPALLQITPAERGEFLLETFPPSTPLSISIPDTNLTLNGGGAGIHFTVSNFTHNNPVTDPSGDATLYLGATLTTTGSTQHYGTGNYSEGIEITINY